MLNWLISLNKLAQLGPPTRFFSFVTSTVSSSSLARMSAEVHGIVSGASLMARWIRCTISAFRDRPFARALASTLIFNGRGTWIFNRGRFGHDRTMDYEGVAFQYWNTVCEPP